MAVDASSSVLVVGDDVQPFNAETPPGPLHPRHARRQGRVGTPRADLG